MIWPACLYFGASNLDGLAAQVQALHDQIDSVLDGKLDGYNVAEEFVAAGGGLAFTTHRRGSPRTIYAPLLSPDSYAYIRHKGYATGKETIKPGLEIVVDASSADFGQVCFIDKDYLDQQLVTVDPDDPATVANPGGEIRTNYGKLRLNTGDDFDLELKRNDTTKIALQSGSIVVSDDVVPGTGSTYDLGADGTPFRTLYVEWIAGVADSTVAEGLNADMVDGVHVDAMTENAIPKIDGASTFVDSLLSDSGSLLEYAGSQGFSIIGTLSQTGGGRVVPVTRTTMSGNVTLSITSSNSHQYMDPNGSDRDVNLPSVNAGNAGLRYEIFHTGGANIITVKNSGGSTIASVEAGLWAVVTYDGTAWRAKT